jgi:hypothetical protein
MNNQSSISQSVGPDETPSPNKEPKEKTESTRPLFRDVALGIVVLGVVALGLTVVRALFHDNFFAALRETNPALTTVNRGTAGMLAVAWCHEYLNVPTKTVAAMLLLPCAKYALLGLEQLWRMV